jgi:dienelactone hydrolase
MNRETVHFVSGDVRCEAWLYVPASAGPSPVIVMAHGLGGTKPFRLDAYAERFTAAGYGCLVFDYRHFGGSEGQPRQLLSISRQLEDWHAAIGYARSRPEFDPERVVVWGTSMGGGHAITLASTDHRLAGAIAQCPFTDGVASTRAIDPVTTARLTAHAVRDIFGAAIGKPPRYVELAGDPGALALMTSADALPGYNALRASAAEVPFDERVTARSALDIVRYAPGRHTQDIECPILFAICTPDTVAPSKPALRQAARAPRGEVRTYDEGHFDIYLGEAFEQVIGDQLDFLARHVPVAPAAPSSRARNGATTPTEGN